MLYLIHLKRLNIISNFAKLIIESSFPKRRPYNIYSPFLSFTLLQSEFETSKEPESKNIFS